MTEVHLGSVAEPASNDKVEKGLLRKILEGLMPAIVAALAGYAGALVISPDQLYRKLFWPDPDHYLGHWSGEVAGRPAELNISRQFFYPGGHAIHVEGVLQFQGSSEKINIVGDTDSRLVLSGRVNAGHNLILALERDVPEIRSPNERYTRLEEKAGEDAASVCPAQETLDDITQGSQCKKLKGKTYFFR